MQTRLMRVGAAVLAPVLAGALCVTLLLVLGQNANARPQGRRCGSPGPLPDLTLYCGCTWGVVLFRGQPVAGARVTLSFGSVAAITTTRFGDVPPEPYYAFDGWSLGLGLNHIATVTAEYDGQIVTRTYRARPDDTDLEDGGQEINLVIPDVGAWLPEPSEGVTLALKIIGNEVWMGGPAGLIRRDLTSRVTVTESTGLTSGVAALAADANGRVWALGSTGQVAVRTGDTWTTMNTGLAGTQRAIVLADDGSLWAGGEGGLSRYDGASWQVQPDFSGPLLADGVMALHRASDGRLWVATWKGGVSRRENDGTWTTFTIANSGINSDRVGGIAETSAGIWFALGDYVIPPRQLGGLSLLSSAGLNSWRTYTQAHGLPLPGTRNVAAAPDGTLWVTTLGGGVARAIQNSDPLTFTVYSVTDGLRSAIASRIALSGPHVFIGTTQGVDRFEPKLRGAPPVAAITQVAAQSVATRTLLYLAGMGSDPDEDERIVGYEWTSNLDGPVCSLVTCTLESPTAILQPCIHTLRLRVLDDEGIWSSMVTHPLMVQGPTRVLGCKLFLPVVTRHSAGNSGHMLEPLEMAKVMTSAVQIAAGSNHTCALTNEGAVQCWGQNNQGQLGNGTALDASSPVTVTGLSGVSAIAAGGDHTCALKSADEVLCWGNNWAGQLGDGQPGRTSRTPVAVNGLSAVRTIATGADHTCALTNVGAVVCWGSNGMGQLGTGTTLSASTPVSVSGLSSGINAIAAGGWDTCALTNAGAALCWGYNAAGQLGNGTTTNASTPMTVTGLSSGVSAIAVGGNHTCARMLVGDAKCWGSNVSGKLGDDTTIDSSTPVPVRGLLGGASAIATGSTHTCALTSAQAARCWGDNWAGKLGDGTTTDSKIPRAVSGLGSDVRALALGFEHTCALMDVPSAGVVLCWGRNNYGQLGNGTMADARTPMRVSGLGNNVSLIEAGWNHTCAVTKAGAALCWGAGLLGNGTEANAITPVGVSGLSSGVRAIAGGWGHTCAVTSAGGVVCWGSNGAGRLGNGTTLSASTPVAVSGLGSGVASISAGGAHNCALTSADAVLCWGFNADGQLGNTTTANANTPVPVSGLGSGVRAVEAGSWHTCALMKTDALLCWGQNSAGQLGNGTTLSASTPVTVSELGGDALAVAAGWRHTCAVTRAGAVLCWGANGSGQLGNGTTLSATSPAAVHGLGGGVAALAAGDSHSCALTNAGAVLCWGANAFGQLGDGTVINASIPVAVSELGSGVVAISSGDAHTCALTNAGDMLCWGANQGGELGTGTAWRETPQPVLGLSNPAPVSTGDSFEADDTCGQAKPLLANLDNQVHTFDKLGDADWVHFTTVTETDYVLIASNLADGALPSFTVRTSCVTPPIASSLVSFGSEVRLPMNASDYPPGIYYFQISNSPTTTFGKAVSYTLSLRANSTNDGRVVGAAIIVAGKNGGSIHQQVITQTTDWAYTVLRRNGFSKDQIFYFDAQTNRDVDGNGLADDIDAAATVTNVQKAILEQVTGFVGPARPLWLYMADHGFADRFLVSGDAASDTITPTQLGGWLNQLERTSGVDQVNVIIDACHAGSFITAASGSISKEGRAVLASTRDDRLAYGRSLSDNVIQRMYFGEALWTALDANRSLKDSFEEARKASAAATGQVQQAWLDDNGDGFPNTIHDGGESAVRGLIGSVQTGGRPLLRWTLVNTTTGELTVTVQSANAVSQVSVEVAHPNSNPLPIPGQVNLAVHDSVALAPAGDGQWRGRYTKFGAAGNYRLMAYGFDEDGSSALPVEIVVTLFPRVFLPVVFRQLSAG